MKRMSQMPKLFATAMLLAATSFANADDFLGDFCWEAMVGDQQEPNHELKLGVSEVGTGHFLLLGKWGSPGGKGNAVHGNAEVVDGGVIRASMQWGKVDSTHAYYYNWVMTLQPDLFGEMRGISMKINRQTDQPGMVFFSESLIPIDCDDLQSLW
jgi:hypothetical protein